MKRLTFLWIILALLACKKEEAEAPIPVISVVEQPQRLLLTLPDTIRLTVELSDADELVSLKVDLLNQALVPVTEGQVYELKGKSGRVNVVFPISDPLIDDGEYFVGLNLNSRRESANVFIKANVVGIPRIATGAVFLARQGNQTHIYQTDSNLNNPALVTTVSCDVHLAFYDAARARIWFAGSNQRNLYYFDLQSRQVVSTISSLFNPGFPVYSSITRGPQWIYLGRGQGNVVGLDANGFQRWLYNLNEGYYPEAIAHLQETFAIALKPFDPFGFRRVQLIEPERLGLIREFPVNGAVLHIGRLNADRTLLLVEEQGQGRLMRYTRSLNRYESETGPDPRNFRSMLPLGNGQFVLLTSQVLLYQPGNSVRTGQFSILSADSAQFVSYESFTNRLLAIRNNQAEIISLGGNGGSGSLLLPVPVLFGFLTRNR
ncbi:MAG: hypothetical protein ACK417_04325 [Bacteroidia bacterium]